MTLFESIGFSLAILALAISVLTILSQMKKQRKDALGDDYNRSKTTSRHLNAMLDNFVDKHQYYIGRPVYIRKEDLSTNYQRFAEYNGLVDLSTMDNPHRRSILDDFYLNQIKKQRSDD